MNERTILLGPYLFEFRSFREWINHAQEWYHQAYERYKIPFARTVAIDQMGRICASGKEFEAASAACAFPVKVYGIELRAVEVEATGGRNGQSA